MLEILFFRVPGEQEYENLFDSLEKKVGSTCYSEARGYRHKGVGVRRLLGEAMVGYALRVFWGLPLSAYEINRGEKGKPYLAGYENIFFNISHSGEYVVCAFSEREVGIDIEKRAKARMKVAGRFFHAEEVEELDALSGEDQDELFYNYWSVKESFLKYIGTGLTRPLNTFIARFSEKQVNLYEEGKKLPLYVLACPVDPGYACYVCTGCAEEPGVREVVLKDLLIS